MLTEVQYGNIINVLKSGSESPHYVSEPCPGEEINSFREELNFSTEQLNFPSTTAVHEQ
jgi:hypothetical protein